MLAKLFYFVVKVCLHVTDFSPSFAPFNVLLPIKWTIKQAN